MGRVRQSLSPLIAANGDPLALSFLPTPKIGLISNHNRTSKRSVRLGHSSNSILLHSYVAKVSQSNR